MPIERRSESIPEPHPELVDALSKELKHPTEKGPLGIEEKARGLNRMYVTVVWSLWKDVHPEDRTAVILDAYQAARGDLEMLKISFALGATPAEAKKMGLLKKAG